MSARRPPVSKKTTPRSVRAATMPVALTRRPSIVCVVKEGVETSRSAVMSATIELSPERTTAQKRWSSTQAISSKADGRPNSSLTRSRETMLRASSTPRHSPPFRRNVSVPSPIHAGPQAFVRRALNPPPWKTFRPPRSQAAVSSPVGPADTASFSTVPLASSVNLHGARTSGSSSQTRSGRRSARRRHPESVANRRPVAPTPPSHCRASAASAIGGGPASPRQARSLASRGSSSSGGPGTPGRYTKTPPSAAIATHRSSGDQASAR